MLVIAHRGAVYNTTENSVAAFEKAIEIGCHRIETDVRRSLDNELYLLHDPSLFHTCGVRRNIREMHSSEVDRLLLHNGECIPKFKEVMSYFLPKIEINFEIKDEGCETVALVVNHLKKSRYKDHAIISSFLHEPLLYFYEHLPSIRRAVLWCLENIQLNPWSLFPPQLFMNACKATIIHPQADLVNESFADQAHHRGWEIYPYVSHKTEKNLLYRHNLWSKLKEFKVHGLCTDYPKEFKEWAHHEK